MTAQAALEATGRRVPLTWRLGARLAVAAAWWLSRYSPERIRTVLNRLRVRATPATVGQTMVARDAVVTVSTRCAGEYCLQRSLAIVLLCRLAGSWPTWCVGVRTDPFGAHAWVEAAGQPIGEPFAAGYFQPILTVPPVPSSVAAAGSP